MKISFGDVLLARFPYTDLTSDKRRPVLVVSASVDADPEIGLKTMPAEFRERACVPGGLRLWLNQATTKLRLTAAPRLVKGG